MSELIQTNVPEIEKSAIMREWWNNEFRRVDQTRKDAVVYNSMTASSDFFTMFDFPLLAGNPRTVLAKPNSVVISEKMANNIFGTTNVIGETLLASGVELTVTGVMKNMPPQHIVQVRGFCFTYPRRDGRLGRVGFQHFLSTQKKKR